MENKQLVLTINTAYRTPAAAGAIVKKVLAEVGIAAQVSVNIAKAHDYETQLVVSLYNVHKIVNFNEFPELWKKEVETRTVYQCTCGRQKCGECNPRFSPGG